MHCTFNADTDYLLRRFSGNWAISITSTTYRALSTNHENEHIHDCKTRNSVKDNYLSVRRERS